MALVNHAKKEINVKIVFCGPSEAGKSTLLKAMYAKLPTECRGLLRSMGLQQDRMLFFDFTHPEGGYSEKYRVRVHVYTLTGAVTQEHAWKMVLKGVDGIAFVADSAPVRQDANRNMFNQVKAALNSYGKVLEDVSMAVLCSKCDIPTALSTEEIRQSLSVVSHPIVPVVAPTGEGVLESLGLLLDGILKNLEGLGLTLQPTVQMFRELSPDRSAYAGSSVLIQPLIQDNIPGSKEVEAADEGPLITFGGSPEISPEGVLKVPLRVNCCERQSTVVLNISLQSNDYSLNDASA